jgi:hypothetical protein
MAYPDGQDDERGGPEPRRPDLSDQLSPNRALQKSVGSSGSQRVGDSGPLANPVVSFRDAPGTSTAGGKDG